MSQLETIREEPEQEDAQNMMKDLKQQPSFLVQKFNETVKSSKAGGVYIPPHKLRAMQEKLLEEDPCSVDHQKMMWDLLRKSINGIVNKVNISNIQNVVIELFNENILRGMGLLAKAIIKAQMASPNFTHVYAALISVINTKLPEIGKLILTRTMILFHRSFKRNNKLVCIASTKMIAHLINQKVLGQYAGLQLLMILLMHATEDSVEIACNFMIEVGQVLSEISPAGSNAIFEMFKNLLHESQIGQKAQYSIEKLFAIRKTGFKSHPGVIAELDLVQEEDQITHNMDFEEQLNGQENLNVFKADPNYADNETEWENIKQEILGEENIIDLKQVKLYEEEVEQYDNEEQAEGIQDLTEQDLINLRKTIYLAIQSTVHYEQCAHKILKMNIAKGYESELIDMIIECCSMDRIYQNFYGLLAERFCKIDDKYKEVFVQGFVNNYNGIFKMQVNKIRNLAKLFGHLFYTQSIDWTIFQVVTLRPDTTTSAHRMFLKILFREIAENIGIEKMAEEFKKQNMREYYSGLFPIGHPNDIRFSINYFTSIGLGQLTQEMREVLELQEEMISERKAQQQKQKMIQMMKEEQEMLRLQEERERKIREEEEMIKRELEKRKREREEKEREQKKKQRNRSKDNKRRHRARSNNKSSSSSSSNSSSSSSSSSSSDSQSQTPEVKDKKNKKRIESDSDSDSDSSGLSSSSSSSSNNSKTLKNKPEQKKQKNQRKSRERSREKIPEKKHRNRNRKSSSSSSSSSSNSSNSGPRRDRRSNRK